MHVEIQQLAHFTNRQLFNLMVTAQEGGTNSWALLTAKDLGSGFPEGLDEDDREFQYHWAPLAEGGSITIEDTVAFEWGEDEPDFEPVIFTRESIKKGLQLAAQHYPAAFNRFVTGQYDAWDADVIMQLGCFGEVVYG